MVMLKASTAKIGIRFLSSFNVTENILSSCTSDCLHDYHSNPINSFKKFYQKFHLTFLNNFTEDKEHLCSVYDHTSFKMLDK